MGHRVREHKSGSLESKCGGMAGGLTLESGPHSNLDSVPPKKRLANISASVKSAFVATMKTCPLLSRLWTSAKHLTRCPTRLFCTNANLRASMAARSNSSQPSTATLCHKCPRLLALPVLPSQWKGVSARAALSALFSSISSSMILFQQSMRPPM